MEITYFFTWNRHDGGDVQQDIFKNTNVQRIINVEIYSHTIPVGLDNN